MSDEFSDKSLRDPRPSSPAVPVALSLNDRFTFDCRKGIACFNACCRNIDIMLTPYDILRLKRRLGLSSQEFLERHTVGFEMDGQGMPGVKMKTKAGSAECQFLTPEGCGVYEDRPAACRYYALGVTPMRKKDSPADEDMYFVVKEPHCLGHDEPKTQTVQEYRAAQGVEIYDEMNREWRQIVLDKRCAGAAVGRPSERSFQLFSIASYELDTFREFVQSESFQEAYDVPAAELHTLMQDDVALMRFGFRFLKQALFGERSIAVKPGALEKRAQAAHDEPPEGLDIRD